MRFRKSVSAATAIFAAASAVGVPSPQASAQPRLLLIGSGMSSCPTGYLCSWEHEGFSGRGVAIAGNETSWSRLPFPFTFIGNGAESYYNHGVVTASPDVRFGRRENLEGGTFTLCNGESISSLPDGRNDGAPAGAGWRDQVDANEWYSSAWCRPWSGVTPDAAMSGPLRADQVKGSLAYLTGKYHITASEAMRRLELQRRLPAIQRQLRHDLASGYAGVWLDQDHGGRLMVAATDPGAAAPVVRDLVPADVTQVVQGRWSLDQLELTSRRLNAILGGGPGKPVDAEVDVKAGKVVLMRHGSAQLTLAEQRAVGGDGDRVVVRQPVRTSPREDTSVAPQASPREAYGRDQCSPLSCDPPMRGGLRLDIQRDDGSWGGCTSGFNLRDSGGVSYVLTAGHCILSSRHHHLDTPLHNGLPVGTELGAVAALDDEDDPTGQDYAIIPFYNKAWADYWVDKRWTGNEIAFFNRCKLGPPARPGYQCDDTGGSFIDGMMPPGQIVGGMVVCATGAASPGDSGSGAPPGWVPGTRCGEVQQARPYVVTNIRTKPGDSGSGLYSEADSLALGILQGGPDDASYYILLQNVLDWAQKKSGIQFHVMTWADR